MVRFLKWLISFFEVQPKTDDKFNVFTPADMVLYEYFDGQKVVKVDPMELFKKWSDRTGVISVDVEALKVPGFDGAEKAYSDVLTNVRWIFDVKPYSNGGLTEEKTLELYNHFTRFLEELKKKRDQSLESSPPTEPVQSPSG